jgi:hypothetical protein
MKILEQAGRANSVVFLNETAKVFRSLLLPALVVAILFSLKLTSPWALVSIALALVSFFVLAFQVYPRLKNLHRIKLYQTVVALLRETKGTSWEQLGGVRIFFWEGTLVATAKATAPVGETLKNYQGQSKQAGDLVDQLDTAAIDRQQIPLIG